HSSKLKQHPSTNYNITSKFSSPIFINVQVNGKRQHAIIDTLDLQSASLINNY
ncbi:unnamed protein product, partial [Rotaria socialis]